MVSKKIVIQYPSQVTECLTLGLLDVFLHQVAHIYIQ